MSSYDKSHTLLVTPPWHSTSENWVSIGLGNRFFHIGCAVFSSAIWRLFQCQWNNVQEKVFEIYIMITKNIRYLLWNRGFWCSLNNTYPLFPTLCIRCTNHLCDSCDLTDVNPHFIPSLLRMIKNVDLLWRHRYKSRPTATVTSQWTIVPAWLLWTFCDPCVSTRGIASVCNWCLQWSW